MIWPHLEAKIVVKRYSAVCDREKDTLLMRYTIIQNFRRIMFRKINSCTMLTVVI